VASLAGACARNRRPGSVIRRGAGGFGLGGESEGVAEEARPGRLWIGGQGVRADRRTHRRRENL